MAAKQILEARVFGSCGGQEFNNVLHFRQLVDDVGDAEDLANHVQGQYCARMDDLTSVDATWAGVLARILTPEVQEPFLNTSNPNISGTIDSPALPTFVSVIIQQRTGFASRRKRGRIYVPAIPQSHVVDGELTAAAQTLYASQLSSILTGLNSGDWELGVYSRTTVAEENDVYAGFTPVSQMTANPVVGTQRRRRIGSGN